MMNLSISISLLVAASNAYTQSLADCQTFAALFDNTCSNTALNVDDIATDSSNQRTCSGISSLCVESDTETDSCTFNTVMCVTCEEVDSVVKIHVQNNGMPRHCWQMGSVGITGPNYFTYDFTAVWNADVYGQMNYGESYFDSADATTTVLCDIQRTQSSNMNEWSGYEYADASSRRLRQPPGGDGGGPGDDSGMEPMQTMAGISIKGDPIYNGLAGGNVDAVATEFDTMDQCLQHTSQSGDIHVHSLTPCANENSSLYSTTDKPPLCNTDSNCVDSGNQATWWIDGWENDTSNYGGVFGIARDGHVIYGPYNGDGELWSCDDHDACNGFFLDDQSYGYAATNTFPYLVGCWGPGPAQTYESDCTTSGCSNSAFTYAEYESAAENAPEYTSSASTLFATAAVALLGLAAF